MAKKQRIRFNVPTGSYALTGVAIALNLGRFLDAAQGTYAITGNDLTTSLVRAPNVLADFGSYAITGNDVALTIDYAFPVPTGSYTITGHDIGTTLTISPSAALDAGDYVVTGNPVTLTITPAGANYLMECESGTYALSFVSPNFITVGPNTRARVGVVGQFAMGQQTAHHVAHAVEAVIPPNTGGGGDPPWQMRDRPAWEQTEDDERPPQQIKKPKKKKKRKKVATQPESPDIPLFDRDIPPPPTKPAPEAPPADLEEAYGPLADDEALLVPTQAPLADFDPWAMPNWFDQGQNQAREQRATMQREAQDAQDLADIQAILELV